jgi:hypothetical protein
VTRRGWKAPPQVAEKIAAAAVERLECRECGAAAGEACIQPAAGKTVHGSRWVAASIATRAARKATLLTPGQREVLAGLPRIPPEEIEKCRTPSGGYSFTRAWFAEHGLPYPPPAGWRKAVERDDNTTTEGTTP